MPIYRYRAADASGHERKGEIEALGVFGAADRLRAEGLSVSWLGPKDPPDVAPALSHADAFSFFNRSLGELSRLGIPLPRAVHEAARGLRGDRFSLSLARLESSVREGTPLDKAVESLPGEFPPYYGPMLRAGAASGDLPGVLSSIASCSGASSRMRKAALDAIAYPMTVLILALAGISCFLWWCSPMFREMYRLSGVQPSTPARAVMFFFGMPGVFPALVAAFGVGCALVGKWLAWTSSGERWLFRLPLVGAIFRDLAVGRMAGMLASMLSSRVPVVEAIPLALCASGSGRWARASEAARARSAEGGSLAESMGTAPGIPAEVVAYLAHAERIGRLPDSVRRLADFAEGRALANGAMLGALLTPVVIVGVGVVMAALFLSMMIPYLGYLEALR